MGFSNAARADQREPIACAVVVVLHGIAECCCRDERIFQRSIVACVEAYKFPIPFNRFRLE